MRLVLLTFAIGMMCWCGTNTALAQPANDDCPNATAVAEGSFPFNNVGTIVDGPSDCDGNMTTDVWYLYTASADGTAIIGTCTSTTLDDTTLCVYDAALGCPLAGSFGLASDDDSCGASGFNSTLSIPVLTGEQYYIQAGGWNGSTGDGVLDISLIAPLTNDDCLLAEPIGEGSFPFANAGATTDGPAECGFGGANDIWYLYSPTADGVAIVDTCGSGFDTILTAYDGTSPCPPLTGTAIDCNDDTCGLQSQISFACFIGQTYLIQLLGYNGASGAGTLNVSVSSLPANDECTGATAVGEGAFPFNNAATVVDGPIDCDANMTTDVWFLYTATFDGDVRIDTCDSTTLDDTTLCVYDAALGCPIAGSVALASDDDSCGASAFLSSIDVPVITGQQLYVQAGGWNGTVGDGVLTITPIISPPTMVSCSADPGTLLWEATWVPGVGGPTIVSQNVYVDGLLAANLSPGDTTFSGSVAGGFVGAVNVCITSVDGLGNESDPVCCDALFGPANDNCVDATPVSEGTFSFSNISTNLDGPIDCDAQMTTDVWFLYTASGDGQVSIGTCDTTGTLDDTTLIVYDGAVCPIAGDPCLASDDDSCGPIGFNSVVSIPVLSGVSYLVQAGGWLGSEGDGTLTIAFVVSPPTGLTCTPDNGAGTIEANWTPGVGGPTIVEQQVFVNGLLEATLPPGDSSYTYVAPGGAAGIYTIDIISVDGAMVASDPATCSASLGGPANDQCIDAIPVGVGATPFDTTLATTDGTLTCGAGGSNIWYEFIVPANGQFIFSLCGSAYDTQISLFDGAGGCGALTEIICQDDSAACGLQSEVSVALTSGQIVYVSVGGSAGGTGTGTLNILQDCGGIGTLVCDYDCSTDTLMLNWTDNVEATAGFDIFENGLLVGSSPAGSPTFSLVGPMLGTNTYEVQWICNLSGALGTGASCTIDITSPITVGAGTTDLVIQTEGTDAGAGVGAVDSGVALETALANNGVSVERFLVNGDFGDLIASGCFDIPGNVLRVWVVTGTFANDGRLTLASLNALDTIAATGVCIYLEGGDHWGFLHTASNLDARDGIEEDTGTNIEDGDDSFTAMDGQAAPLAGTDLSSYIGTIYGQDQVGNDWTDRLSLTGTTAGATGDPLVTSAEALWLNNDDTATGEPAYLTGVVALHTDGGVMISQSWEFGGFSLDPLDPAASQAQRDALAAEYLAVCGGVVGGPQFSRGDANADGGRNIADAIFILGNLFPGPGGPTIPPCLKAADANDDGGINIADAIALLGNLFPSGGPSPLPAPFPGCGEDPTMDALSCDSFPSCP